MGIVKRYEEPETAGDLVRLIQTFLVSEFGWGTGGGENEHGGELDLALDDEDVCILVMPASQAHEMKHLGRVWDGRRLEWLSAEERAIVEAYRDRTAGVAKAAEAEAEADGEDDGPAINCTHWFRTDGLNLTVESFVGSVEAWKDHGGRLIDGWSACTTEGGEVVAVRVTHDGARTRYSYSSEVVASLN